MAVRRRKSARRNRMPSGLARYWAKHRKNPRRRRRSVMRNRRRARRNYASAGMVAMNRPARRNRRRARRNPVHHRRHHARRNPQFLGFNLPPVMDIAMAGAGMLVSPMLANYVFNNYVAGTSMGTSKYAYLGVEAASVIGLGWAARKFVGVQQGNMFLIGGGVRFVLDAIQVLAPTLLPSVAMPTGLQGMGAQPFLGYYNTMPRKRALGFYNSGSSAQGSMIRQIPSRLDPGFRY
jgi:hypothetical protein